MSALELLPAAPSEACGARVDRMAALRALAAENVALALRLRGTQIPQHVGMAAASRALAVELPGVLLAHVEADLCSGTLAKRWEDVRAAAAEPEANHGFDSTLVALAMLLREQTRAVMRHLISREKEWAADAYRLEGQAAALETQADRLLEVVGPAAPAPATDNGTGGANGAANGTAVDHATTNAIAAAAG